MMLEPYRERYIKKNVQFILINLQGIVQESDDVLFEAQGGRGIVELHPFFESLAAIFESPENEIDFHCVHLTIEEKTLLVDIKAHKKKKGLLLIIYDFTAQYHNYQLVAQTRNESVIKTELTVLKNLELAERERFKDRFIQNFSHEIRNPLTAIMAITDILRDTDLNVEQRQMLGYLKESNTKLKLMLEDIISMSMINTGRLALTPRVFDLKGLFDLLAFTYRAKTKEKGLTFIASWDDALPEFVEADQLRLYQVTANILENALKYTTKGAVTFRVKLNQKRANRVSLRFYVKDTGMGIAQENIPLIFESFKQLNTNTITSGNGLGLAIAEGILNVMESSIKVASKVDQGSEFYFDLGLRYEVLKAEKDKVDQPKKNYRAAVGVKRPKLKVLMVEDDVQVRTTLFKILLSTARFHIDTIHDGALVLQEVIKADYDCIIMDVNLPNLSGDRITTLIREFPFKNVNTIPIIGISADAYPENIKKCRNAGMNTVLLKPFAKEEFLDAIFKVLGKSKR